MQYYSKKETTSTCSNIDKSQQPYISEKEKQKRLHAM